MALEAWISNEYELSSFPIAHLSSPCAEVCLLNLARWLSKQYSRQHWISEAER